MQQKSTIKKEVSLAGIGLHSGKKVRLSIKPSDRGDIIFRRVDLNGLEFLIDPKNIITHNSSILESGKYQIRTIEHLLAVLSVFGLDSVIIELDGEEVPITDGSALPLVNLLESVGIITIPMERPIIEILEPFSVAENEAWVKVNPDEQFKITYEIFYSHPLIGSQSLSLKIDRPNFCREIAPARTFGFLKDVAALREKGLAKGGSLENALVLDSEKVLNGSLRFKDEFVRHKILDLVGDLAVLGCALKGHFHAYRAGHRLHLAVVRYLLDKPHLWACNNFIRSG